jgi:hypothetical protein
LRRLRCLQIGLGLHEHESLGRVFLRRGRDLFGQQVLGEIPRREQDRQHDECVDDNGHGHAVTAIDSPSHGLSVRVAIVEVEVHQRLTKV